MSVLALRGVAVGMAGAAIKGLLASNATTDEVVKALAGQTELNLKGLFHQIEPTFLVSL